MTQTAAASSRANLRVLIANESLDVLVAVAILVEDLGHEVVARSVETATVADLAAREQPDVALVSLGPSQPHALRMIEEIARRRVCPVIALGVDEDPEFSLGASARGVFAVVKMDDPHAWPAAIDIVLNRFADLHELRGAFDRRATIEQAKGILMERHKLTADSAFAMLRDHARGSNAKVFDVAASVAAGVALLPNLLPPV